MDRRPAEPEWDSDAGAELERSPSGVRTDQRTSKGARDSERRSEAGAEPERSPSGAEDPERTTGLRKDARVPKLHYSETAESPIISARLNDPRSHQSAYY